LTHALSKSRQWRLAARPPGKIRDSDFELIEMPVPEPADRQFVVDVTYISLDPAMRGWMNAGCSYLPPVGKRLAAILLPLRTPPDDRTVRPAR